MNKIPKCKTKYFIPQGNHLKVASKEPNKENLAPKITQKNLKFSSNRQFGKDITNSVKGNIHSIYNNHCSKIIAIADKKQSNKIYIKKHSSASQVSQKNQKLKIAINDKKLRENKSGFVVNKKNNISTSEYYYYKKSNNLKNDYAQQQGSKLHSSISFGINNSIRPISSNNSISVRLSNPKNKIHTSLNNRSINIYNNNYDNNENINYNNKIEITHSNLDLM